MSDPVVGVLATLDEEPAEGAEEHMAAQQDQNRADHSLQRILQSRGDRDLEGDDSDAGAQERERVASTPERAEEARPYEPALSRYERRHCRDVISVEGVPEAQEQPESEGGCQ
jgi:hypothetical protein